MKNKVVIIREGVVASIVNNILDFGVVLGILWVNQNFFGGVWVLNVIAFLAFFAMLANHVLGECKRYDDPDDAIEFLEKIKNEKH